MKKVQVGIFALLLLTQASAYADFASCERTLPVHESSYMIVGPSLTVLKSKRPLDRNRNVTFAQMIPRVESQIDKVHKDLPDITNEKLAVVIAAAADTSGIDFSILTQIVRKESKYCIDRHNEKGGDSGCMQFTTPALKELRDQFGIMGAKNHAPGVPEVMRKHVSDFYQNAPEREKAFYRWLNSKTTTAMRVQLRTGTDQDIDILAGALLLKIKLAVARGNYKKAIRAYNGSKRQVAYEGDISAGAQRVSYYAVDPQQCYENAKYEQDIFEGTCDMNDDDCFVPDRNFSEPLDVPSTNT